MWRRVKGTCSTCSKPYKPYQASQGNANFLPIDVQSHDAALQVGRVSGHARVGLSLATLSHHNQDGQEIPHEQPPPMGAYQAIASPLSLFFLVAQAACSTNGCVYVYGVGKLSLPADRVHGRPRAPKC